MRDMDAFARLVGALRPWLGQLVIVGGWAHRLHRLHPLANPPLHLPIMTKDADIAFGPAVPLAGDIGAALRADGFDRELLGHHTPPVSRYRLRGGDQGFSAEFLAPLTGSGVRRSGAPDATLRMAGVTAQKLRHMDLLLLDPWRVRLGKEVGVPIAPHTEVLIANPATFIAQKLLIQADRDRDKQAQDVLYVHDTLELFGGELEALRETWQELILKIGESTVGKVGALARTCFAEVTDVIRGAARIPQDRHPTPERIRQACAYGMEQVFGP